MPGLYGYATRLAAAALCGAALLAPSARAEAANPFPQLNGTWSGSGQVQFDQSKTEQIMCKAYYTVKSAGSGLALAIRCASSSYKIEMRANLDQRGDRVIGKWEERTFNAEGSIAGRATDRNLTLAISGAVSGSMSVAIGPSGHRVDIRTSTAGLSGVSINLTRS